MGAALMLRHRMKRLFRMTELLSVVRVRCGPCGLVPLVTIRTPLSNSWNWAITTSAALLLLACDIKINLLWFCLAIRTTQCEVAAFAHTHTRGVHVVSICRRFQADLETGGDWQERACDIDGSLYLRGFWAN